MYLITFESTHHAIKAKKMLGKHAIQCELIATPREISSECGFCLLIDTPDYATIKKLVKLIRPAQIFKKQDTLIYRKLDL